MSRLALAALLIASAPVVAGAASLSVAPTRVELRAGDATGVVTLQNNAAEPVMVQVQTFAWPRSPASADLEPTRDLLAVPPVFELSGNARQIIRVALRGAVPAEREHAYRLLITEVPRGGAEGTGVRFALRLSLPVFVIPPGAAPEPVWSVRSAGQRSELVLRNQGTAHLQVRRIRHRPAAGGGPGGTIDTPAYVLAGQEHGWPLPTSPGPEGLQLEAETSIGPLSVAVAAPRG
jgi:fimbrial chaperone protein